MANISPISADTLRRLTRLPLISPRQWLRRLVFWVGAVLVAGVAIGFAALADRAANLFVGVQAPRPWIALLICPAGLAASFLLTRYVFPGAQGSGIPQVIAAQHMTDRAAIARVLSPRIAAGKIGLTLLGLCCGASIGREGPTVQVGASIMHALGRLLRLPRLELERALVLAGGAAGVAAAFNTPLAGIVFAIEELSHSFEARTSGTVLTAVIIAGITTLALMGNYTYFGHTCGGARFRPRLDRGGAVQCGGRTVRRLVQCGADPVRQRPAGPGRPLADAQSGGVRGAVRTGAGGDRHCLGRPDLWHRLRSGARHGGGHHDAAGVLCRVEIRRHGDFVYQRHSGRPVRAVAVGRRGAWANGWRTSCRQPRRAPSSCSAWWRISPAWCRRRSRRRSS